MTQPEDVAGTIVNNPPSPPIYYSPLDIPYGSISFNQRSCSLKINAVAFNMLDATR